MMDTENVPLISNARSVEEFETERGEKESGWRSVVIEVNVRVEVMVPLSTMTD